MANCKYRYMVTFDRSTVRTGTASIDVNGVLFTGTFSVPAEEKEWVDVQRETPICSAVDWQAIEIALRDERNDDSITITGFHPYGDPAEELPNHKGKVLAARA